MLAARVLSNNWSVIGKDNKMADLEVRDANANDVILFNCEFYVTDFYRCSHKALIRFNILKPYF